jgi:hypothetical protein
LGLPGLDSLAFFSTQAGEKEGKEKGATQCYYQYQATEGTKMITVLYK